MSKKKINKIDDGPEENKFCYYIETLAPLCTLEKWDEWLKFSKKYQVTHLQPLSNFVKLQQSNPNQDWKIIEKLDELMRETDKIRGEYYQLLIKQGKQLNKQDKTTLLPYMFRIVSAIEDTKNLQGDITLKREE